MLDIKALQALHDLLATTLFHAEVARLPVLSREEEVELVSRARQGDVEARAELVVSCLRYALGKAHYYYHTRRPAHDDELDLAQVASLEMVASLDVALTKRSPVPYLRSIAARSISIYLTYFSGFIHKPTRHLDELARIEMPTVESLDTKAFREGTELKIDLIEMAPPPDEVDPDERFAPLYEALAELTPRQRNAIIYLYQVQGEIDPSARTYNHIDPHTFKRLRIALEKHLTQMLWPKQKE